ncbi:BrnT family toxin [Treponema sp. R80B11-R83G3]
MGKTIISEDGRFEWDENKDRQNKKKHGFSFNEILEIFDDPSFLEGYDYEHSIKEERYYGIGCLNNVLYIIAFYTLREISVSGDGNQNLSSGKNKPPRVVERRRLISARRADSEEQENYNDYFKKIKL